MHIHFIQQEPEVTPGEYLAWAEREGYNVSYTRVWMFEPLPEPGEDIDLLIILGGPQNPGTTKTECPHFDSNAQAHCIRRFVDAGKLVIGSCLGAQLLGEAMGAHYEHSPEREIGPVNIWITDEGKKDPILKDFPDEFTSAQWHADMPGLTPGAKVLASSDGCPRQIVRYAPNAYGLQCHMEFNREVVSRAVEWDRQSLDSYAACKYVSKAEEILRYDYSGMNRLLSSFLARLVNKLD